MRMGYLLGLLIIVGCTSLPRTVSPTADRTLFYPLGLYQHDIKIKTTNGNEYSFRGVVKIGKDKVTVVGLSPFQTTVFKVEEDRKTGKVDTEIYYEQLERRKEQLLEFYSTLRTFLVFKKVGKTPQVQIDSRDDQNRIKTLTLKTKTDTTPAEVNHYDENEIADNITLRHSRFEVTIKVIGYEI